MNSDNFSLDQSPPPAVTQDAVGFAVLECNRLHNRSQEAIAQGVALAVILGYQLTKLKNSLPHGQFGKLFKQNGNSCRFDFKERMSRNYMKIYKGLMAKLKGDDRHAFGARCSHGEVDSVVKFMEKKFPGIDTIRAALNVLDDSKKETAEYDPNQFDHDAPTETPEDNSPVVQGMLNFNVLSQSVVQLEDWVAEKAAVISMENRRLVAAQLKELADRLITL